MALFWWKSYENDSQNFTGFEFFYFVLEILANEGHVWSPSTWEVSNQSYNILKQGWSFQIMLLPLHKWENMNFFQRVWFVLNTLETFSRWIDCIHLKPNWERKRNIVSRSYATLKPNLALSNGDNSSKIWSNLQYTQKFSWKHFV